LESQDIPSQRSMNVSIIFIGIIFFIFFIKET
jgi:hypothetical protein